MENSIILQISGLDKSCFVQNVLNWAPKPKTNIEVLDMKKIYKSDIKKNPAGCKNEGSTLHDSEQVKIKNHIRKWIWHSHWKLTTGSSKFTEGILITRGEKINN